MKKILFIALLLIPFLGFSQTTKPIDGFLGIKFGTSRATVVAAIKAKGGVVDSTSDTFVSFEKVSLGHRLTNWVVVRFIDDKAYLAIFDFTADVDDHAIDYYNALVSDINDVYGKGKSGKVFRSTFHDGDGYEITAIQEGDADYVTVWQQPDKNFIKATISIKLNILLYYADNTLNEEANAREKVKEKGDL